MTQKKQDKALDHICVFEFFCSPYFIFIFYLFQSVKSYRYEGRSCLQPQWPLLFLSNLAAAFKISFGLLNPEKMRFRGWYLASNTASLMKKIHHSAPA